LALGEHPASNIEHPTSDGLIGGDGELFRDEGLVDIPFPLIPAFSPREKEKWVAVSVRLVR
jgi:hypothetical protein